MCHSFTDMVSCIELNCLPKKWFWGFTFSEDKGLEMFDLKGINLQRYFLYKTKKKSKQRIYVHIYIYIYFLP